MTYRHRNGAVTAGDTWYLMNLDGTLATPGPLTVPVGMNRITQIIFGLGDIAPTAATDNLGLMLKLTGVSAGEAIIVLGATTTTLAGAGGNSGVQNGAWRYDVDIPVKSGTQLSPYICATLGVDANAIQASITFGFST
jgi:hypothetical protein